MPDRPTTADELRRAFIDFFVARGHTEVPSASVIPVDKTLLFTIAGMVPFKSYFVGEETPPYKRATRRRSACAPAASRTTSTTSAARTATSRSSRCSATSASATTSRPRRSTSAMEFYRDVLQLDMSRLWVTVHEDDDEAERIWRDDVGFPADRIQRLGDDNWWSMGDTGPCGPSSEIFWDLGPEYGPDGGPDDRPRPLHRDLESRVHDLRPARRRHARAAAEAEHRHRRRARTQPPRRCRARRRSGTSTCSGP